MEITSAHETYRIAFLPFIDIIMLVVPHMMR